MIKVDQCPVCNSDKLEVLRELSVEKPTDVTLADILSDELSDLVERQWLFFEKIWKEGDTAHFGVALCRACGFVFSNPRFTPEEIEAKYEAISSVLIPKTRPERKARNRPLKTDSRAERIHRLIRRLGGKSGAGVRVLDYGGMFGQNLIPFAKSGSECILLDYLKFDHPEEVRYAGRDLRDLQVGMSFDTILLCHVLEHATDPARLVGNLAGYLEEGGLIYIEVPLGCRDEWRYLKETLMHVNFFSEECVYKCLRMSGLDVTYLSTKKQWVTHGKLRCVNGIACKRQGVTVRRFKTTQQQLEGRTQIIRKFRENPWKQTKAMVKNVLKKSKRP